MNSGIKHYIELNSAYRDRIKYPNPAEFVVNFGQGDNCDGECISCFSAINPVSDSYPIYNFQSSDSQFLQGEKFPFLHVFPFGCPWGGGNSEIPILSGFQSVVCSTLPTQIKFLRTAIGDRKIFNSDCPLSKLADEYYNGMDLTLLNTSQIPAEPTFSSRIINYKIDKGPECIIGTDKVFYIPYTTLEKKISSSFNPTNDIWDIPNTNKPNKIRIQGGPPTTGAYCGYYMECVNLDIVPNPVNLLDLNSRFKKIIAYDGNSRIATLENSFPTTSTVSFPPNPARLLPTPVPPPGILKYSNYFNNFFRVRKSLPYVMGWGNFTLSGIPNTQTTAPLTPYFPPGSTCCPLTAQFHDVMRTSSPYNTGINIDFSVDGAVYEFGIVSCEIGTWVIDSILTVSTGLAEIFILGVYDNKVTKLRVNNPGNPGGGYSIGQIVTAGDGTGNVLTLRVCKIGTSFGITPQLLGANLTNTTGDLSLEYNAYKGDVFYMPVRGPEYADMNNLTDTANSIFGAYPEYYRQFPLQLCTKQDYSEGVSGYNNNAKYNFNKTGATCILAYIVEYDRLSLTPESVFIIVESGVCEHLTMNTALWPVVTNCDGDNQLTTYDWEILPFSKDSVNPLNYTGSLVSNSQMVCYELKIATLILPNEHLRSGFGGLIAFYPFVYVEITNESASSGHERGLIYSNNPNSVKATFRVALNDINKPIATKFVKQRGDMIQTIKFKPTDNLKFRVFFGDGDTFTTITPDNIPPSLVNPLLQVCGLFEIRRY
jgi:hypothetical protein